MKIEIDNLTEAQAIAIEDMLAVWVTLGNIGASRNTTFFADGDGNFHPKITVDGEKPKRFVHPTAGAKKYNPDYRIDFDEIAWLLRDYKKEELQSMQKARANYRHKDEPITSVECEKCGGEMSPRIAGDESYNRCPDCGHIQFN